LSAPADKGGDFSWIVSTRKLSCATRAVFLSGNQGFDEFRDGNAGRLEDLFAIPMLLILGCLHDCAYWPPCCNINARQEAVMIHRTFFLHYRAVREAITSVGTVGMALLLGYLILWARL
jgi:hypothetical protein